MRFPESARADARRQEPSLNRRATTDTIDPRGTPKMANTVIGSTIVIDGEITGSDALVVQGAIKGRIQITESVFVENSARLEADLDVETVELLAYSPDGDPVEG